MQPHSPDSGFTIVEMIVSLGIASIITAIAVMNLNELTNPALNAASEVSGFMKKARARALATTSAYTVTASGPDRLVSTFGDTCASVNQTVDDTMSIDLSSGASLDSQAWSICFSSRGFPSQNLVIGISDIYEGSSSVEILLGGSIRIQ